MRTVEPNSSGQKDWHKFSTTRLRYTNALRVALIGFPLGLVIWIIEILTRHLKKDLILFAIPYAELCENSRWMFEHLMRNPIVGTRPILFVYNGKLSRKLSDRYPGAVVNAKSWAGFCYFFRSKLVVISRGNLIRSYLPFYFHKKYKYVFNLWHGIPLKRIGKQARRSFESQITFGWQRYDKMISCSKIEQLALAACYHMSIDDVIISNTPRNDILFRHREEKGRGTPDIVLYAPTYRDNDTGASLFNFADTDINRLLDFLDRHNLRLVIRRHLIERKSSQGLTDFGSRIIFDDGTVYESIQELLCETAILITDFSSVYLDYVILDRPIIFLSHDIDSYDDARGLLFDYESVTPGPKAHNFTELMRCLDLAAEHPDAQANARQSIFDQFHLQKDGMACVRLTESMQSVVAQNQTPAAV